VRSAMQTMTRFDDRAAQLLAIVAGALVVALLLAGFAFAAAKKGATYSGRLKPEAGPASEGLPISLDVSASGTKATVKMESFPLFCEGGGPPQVVHFKPAKISGDKFTASGTEKTEKQFGGELTATATVTGKFLAGGRERGTFKDKFPKFTDCGGSTTYTTKVAPQ
jgi:hypothetical protein